MPVKFTDSSLNNIVLLEDNETMQYQYPSTFFDMDIKRTNPDTLTVLAGDTHQKVVTWFFQGYLIITNKRLLFLAQTQGFFGPKDEFSLKTIIQLENVQSISIAQPGFLTPGKLLINHIVNGKLSEIGIGERDSISLNFGNIKLRIEQLVKDRKSIIKNEQEKKNVQYIIDFSFLKYEMEKGGLALTVIKCPSCGGSVKLPESGNNFICNFCNSVIHASDIFDRLKTFLPTSDPKIKPSPKVVPPNSIETQDVHTCDACRAEVKAKDKFCPKCGNKFDE